MVTESKTTHYNIPTITKRQLSVTSACSHIRIDIEQLYLKWLTPTTINLGPKYNYNTLFLDLLQLSATLLHHIFYIQPILVIIPILVVSLLHNPILVHNTLHVI